MQKNCKQCKAPIDFTTRSNSALYCSVACYQRATNERTAEYRANYQRARSNARALDPSPDKLQCAICKRYYRRVVRHVNEAHGMTARQYKQDILDVDVIKGLLTPQDRANMRRHTKRNGTINNLQAGKGTRYQPNDKRAGNYRRSAQTMARLHVLHKTTKKAKAQAKREKRAGKQKPNKLAS